MKQSIRRADQFNLQSLAVITNALADLEIVNPTLLTIVKQILLNKIDKKALTHDGQPLISGDKPEVSTVDCAMFMTAFSRAQFFSDPALQESLIACFIERLSEADGPTTVTLLQAYGEWVHHMIDETLVKKKQPRRFYHAFCKYNDQVLLHVLRHLISNADEINARGCIMMLMHGRLWAHKKRDNMRMMKDFAVRAIGCLARERDSLGDLFEQYCVQYYDLSKQFCLKEVDIKHLQRAFQDSLHIDVAKLQFELDPLKSTRISEPKPESDSLDRLLQAKKEKMSSIEEAYNAVLSEEEDDSIETSEQQPQLSNAR